MIAEMFIKPHAVTGKTTAVVYPARGTNESRDYSNLTAPSRERLERMMLKYKTRTYLRKSGVAVWIAR